MSFKNVRNDSGYTTLNFNAERGETGPTGATGMQGSPGSMVYSYQDGISITYDPLSQLFLNPISSTISCEKMGNKIFIKVNGFVEFPYNQASITSTASVPVGFRPINEQLTICMVYNGYIDPTLLLRRVDVASSYYGVCKLSPSGTLTFSPDRPPNIGPISVDLTTQTAFQGGNNCGIMSQTLVFDAN